MTNPDDNTKPFVVMAGPLPPLIGGMATVIDDISRSSLSKEVNLLLFDTAKRTPPSRPFWQGVVARINILKQWWSTVGSKPKVIAHIHTCSGLSFFLDSSLLVAAYLRRVPVVFHIHGARFDEFLSGLPAPALYLVRWLMRRTAKVIVLSEEWRQKLLQYIPDAPLLVIENGVPVPSEGPLKANSSDIKLLFLGNLCKRKGVWELLDAMRGCPPSVNLIFAGGEEDEGIGEKLNNKIKEYGLDSQVRWIGPVMGNDKNQILQNSDIFILPSYAEGLPISLLEAMCAGLAVVTTPVGGIPTVVKHNEEGLVVPVGDREALAKAINRLAQSSELRNRLGQKARTTCANKYGIEKAAAKYLEMYREICSASN
jgi:glycosyltransferase involved in cell wall biosynthesis